MSGTINFKLKSIFNKFILVYFVAALVAGFTLVSETHSPHAAGTVTQCTPFELYNAVKIGGWVSFTCDGVLDMGSATLNVKGTVTLDPQRHSGRRPSLTWFRSHSCALSLL